jgi:hypothetical protein
LHFLLSETTEIKKNSYIIIRITKKEKDRYS